MCSYSTVDGSYACQNPYLLGTVLRQQFGFGGFVTSDWYATHATAASAHADLDQCLDDTRFSTTPGTPVQIWSCTGAATQSWVQP